MMKISNPVWSYRYRARRDVREWVGKHAPKIRARWPQPPESVCPICGKPFVKICAVHTGDGWDLFWECENECGDGDSIYNWWPFHFGAHCSGNDLRRVGIEVV
jgi:hypothetical protein